MLSMRARERLSEKMRMVYTALVVAVLAAGGYFYAQPNSERGLVECLARSGTVLYGTFWCEDCEAQRERAGAAASLLPYFECSTPDGQRQKEACRTAEITHYPTWVFPGGARYEGVLDLSEAAARAGCPA